MQIAGKNVCWDLQDGIIDDGTPIHIWDCDGAWNQLWVFDTGLSAIRLAQDMSKCIDAGDMNDGTALKLWTCNGQPQQQFGYDDSMKTVYLSSSGSADASKCIDIKGGALEAGTLLEVWDCTGCWNQQFSATSPDSKTASVTSSQVSNYHTQSSK